MVRRCRSRAHRASINRTCAVDKLTVTSYYMHVCGFTLILFKAAICEKQ